VRQWFREAGFEQIETVDWRVMPKSEQENFERNVGVRGWRPSFSPANKHQL
jgi:hypothetical protein